MAVALPVVVGCSDIMAERARRSSLCGASTTALVFVGSIGGGSEAERLVVDPDLGIVFDAKSRVPAAVRAVELEQVSGSGRAALDLVQVHDIEAVFPTGIAIGAAHAAQGSAQCKPSH